MATIPEALATAIQHHQGGRLQAAEQIYRQILAVEPNQPDALHLLGVIASQVGRHDIAIEYIGRAIGLQGGDAGFHINLGSAYRALGRVPEAVACYRRALALKPDYAEAHNILGNALKEEGTLGEAVACYRQAVALKPDYAEAYHNLGVGLNEQGKLDEAIVCWRRALELKPDYAGAHNNLGVVFAKQGNLDEAIACCRRALALKPDFADAHNNLGALLKDQGKLEEAIVCFRRTLELEPDYAGAHSNLGNALMDRGKLDEAVACYRRAVALKPDFAEAHSNLANALRDQGKLDEAIACCRRALELKPDYAEAHNNLGVALRNQGKLDEAIACCRRAVALKPDYAEAHNNLGNALKEQRKLDEAIARFRRALELKPDYAEAYSNLGNALKDQGKLDEAAACYRRALELKPDYAASLGFLVHTLQHMCCWEGLDVLSGRVIDIVDRNAGDRIPLPIPPFAFLTLPATITAEQQLRCAQQWIDGQLKAKNRPECIPARHRLSASKPKLTIAYLSADFHSHATAWLVAELIEKHDRDRFVVYGYSCGPDDGSPMRRRLVNAFDRFVDVKDASFAEAAERIVADGVDILVDLKGYTTDCRTEILSLRPAPIQVNYLGYPGTMGADFMDYILVDDYIVPPDQQPFFTEKLVHLPGCYQVNDSQREIAQRVPSRDECGLPADGFVFCSFNNSYKITPAVFAVWMKLLKAVPGSVLWLLEGNRFAPANLYREAEALRVAAERLVFAPRTALPEHLARHRLAHLFLDTFPVNAHTTASDALWAGCPVLTLAGETFISRVAGSLLRAIGLPELVTTSLDDYRSMALRLTRNRALLADIRTRLKANRKGSPLFDGGQFARNLEKAYLTMWEIYASGEKPRAFAVGPRTHHAPP